MNLTKLFVVSGLFFATSTLQLHVNAQENTGYDYNETEVQRDVDNDTDYNPVFILDTPVEEAPEPEVIDNPEPQIIYAD